jgi:hypothetical protein
MVSKARDKQNKRFEEKKILKTDKTVWPLLLGELKKLLYQVSSSYFKC